MKFILIFWASTIVGVQSQDVDGKNYGNVFKPEKLKSGPWVEMTKGAIWPKPAQQISSENYFLVDPQTFKFKLSGTAGSCKTLKDSLKRFHSRAFPGRISALNMKSKMNNAEVLLDQVEIVLTDENGCENNPHEKMDESYQLTVGRERNAPKAYIKATSSWGALRGLESFTQLIYSTKESGFKYHINETEVDDKPRFSYRSVMLDSSRHFLSMKILIDNFDLMEMNKMNAFHWHLTDDPSFPFESTTFPNLTKYGAYDSETHVYTSEDVSKIIEEARIRGIRVIPEFDTPGHTKSWELGQPGLLTPCEDNGKETGIFGPMDPTSDSTFEFLNALFEEIVNRFPDKYLHLGADEIDLKSCWPRNARLKKFMDDQGMYGDYKKLESYFLSKLQSLLCQKSNKKQTIVWQDAFENGKDDLDEGTIIEVWKDWGHPGWKGMLKKITANNRLAILSAPWYLNYIKYGSDWVKFYNIDPLDFEGNENDKKLVLGGEVCLWGEFVNSMNAIPRLWPRASAAAEVLWSQKTDDLNFAASRLQEHECRMMARGKPVQPVVGAGFCPGHWDF